MLAISFMMRRSRSLEGQTEGDEDPQGRLVEECRKVHSWLIISGAKVMLSRTKRCGKCDNGVESVTERCVNLHKLHTLLTVFVKKIVPLHREDDGYDARTIPETIPISP
jgi:hypothetical protein